MRISQNMATSSEFIFISLSPLVCKYHSKVKEIVNTGVLDSSLLVKFMLDTPVEAPAHLPYLTGGALFKKTSFSEKEFINYSCNKKRREFILNLCGYNSPTYFIKADSCADQNPTSIWHDSPKISRFIQEKTKNSSGYFDRSLQIAEDFPGELIINHPSVTWGRTVYTDQAWVANYLAAFNHPDVRQKGIHFNCDVNSTAITELEYSLDRDFLMRAFGINSFIVEVHFSSNFTAFTKLLTKLSSLFGARCLYPLQKYGIQNEVVEIHLKNPVFMETLTWIFEHHPAREDSDWFVKDPLNEHHITTPWYFQDKYRLMEWLFRHF